MTDIIVNPKPLYEQKSVWGQSTKVRKSTLNAGFWKWELERITKENYQMLKWLQKKKPTMDVLKWENERKRQERRLENICYHPHMFKASGMKQYGSAIMQPPMNFSENKDVPPHEMLEF